MTRTIKQWRPTCPRHLEPMVPVYCKLGDGYDPTYRAFKCPYCTLIHYRPIKSDQLRTIIDQEIEAQRRRPKEAARHK